MRMSTLTTIRAAVAACLLLGALTTRAGAEAPQPSYQLAAASGEPVLWLVVGELDPKEKSFVNSLAYLDRSSTQIKTPIGVRPQIGQLARSAVVGEDLHVFYQDGTHQQYSRTRQRREVRLPGAAVPEAIAGEAGARPPLLWAVVRDETAAAVAADWEKTLREQSSQPAQEASASQPQSRPVVTSRPSQGYALVFYDGSHWEPGFDAPGGLHDAARIWLCVSGGRFHLLWQPRRDMGRILYAWSDRTGWTTGPPLSLSHAPRDAAAAVINTELVFAALLQAPTDPARLRVETLRRPARATDSTYWNPSGALKTTDDKSVTLQPGSAIAAFAGNLVLLQMSGGQPEVGFWDLARGGAPEQPFHAVPLRRETGETQRQRSTRDLATLLVVAVVLLLILWRRQGGFPVAVALPSGLSLAPPAKRFLGGFLDMLPAAVVVAWWWWQPLSNVSNELRASSSPEAIEAAYGELFWAGVTFRVTYTLYCLIFELFWNRTPGKWLLGEVVISESFTPPTWLQICIRNICRLVELEPYLQVWPFMVVLVVTRSRQRIGDLLARTLVIDTTLTPEQGEPM